MRALKPSTRFDTLSLSNGFCFRCWIDNDIKCVCVIFLSGLKELSLLGINQLGDLSRCCSSRDLCQIQ